MSKRKETSDKRAQKVCRELRFLLAKDSRITSRNSQRLMKHLFAWMNTTGKVMYERP